MELAKRYPGRALKEKVASLWQDIQLLYSEHHVEYKLHTLTPEVLNKGKSKKKTSQVATLKRASSCSEAFGTTVANSDC